jgi:murein endopeptidase
MKANNQLVVLSGILVLLATATIAASNIVQPANAAQPPNPPNAYGKEQIAGTAQTGNLGGFTSGCAQGGGVCSGIPGNTENYGIAEFRANGDKCCSSNNDFGKGGPNFR